MQKLIESYREATVKARKSEKALRQMQRKTYAQLVRCSVRSYDGFKESMQMSRSLFQLEPMKCEQVFKLNSKNSTLNASKGTGKPLPIGDSQQVNFCTNTPLATKHESTHVKKPLNVLQSNMCATKRSKIYGRNQEIACNQLQLAGTQNLSNSASVDCREKLVTLSSGVASLQMEKSIAHAGSFANGIRKQKRSEDISDELKKNNLTLYKKQKVDRAHVNNYGGTQNICIDTSIELKGKVVTSLNGNRIYAEKRKKHEKSGNDVRKRKRAEDILDESKTTNYTPCKKQKLDKVSNFTTTRIPKICNHAFKVNNKERQDLPLCRKQNIIKGGQTGAPNKNEMKYKRTATSDKPYKTQKCNPSLIAVSKPKLGCKWIERKLNRPVIEYRSKIPLLIHQIGSKNESNLAAHMKKLVASKSLSLQKKNRAQLKIPGLKEISMNVANSR